MAEWGVPGYTELKALGSGGFGDVVLARHNVSGTLVAIKYLHGDLLADPEFAEMFRGEATVLASLDDPNVVRLYEYVESPSGAAIVMELIDGVSLREILTHQGQTTAEAALVVLQGSLLGLAAAHRHGVVHRDYKPENVLVDGGGASKLTDFGIAARAGDRPVPAGTLAYAAPEQMAGASASPAGDVYAATATFYECLTGRPPFTGESTAALLLQHHSEPVPLEPVPVSLRPLVAAGMAKDPGQRPTDANTLVSALKAAASGAYGPDWEDRGRSHLGEAALLLAALWPSGGPPAVEGIAVERIPLTERNRRSQLRHFGAAKAAIVAVIVVAVAFAAAAVGTALAAGLTKHGSTPSVTLPAVTIVSPASGSTAGGSSVTITGTGLAGATDVRFGGVAGKITGDSGTQITVTSPPSTGTVDKTETTAAITADSGTQVTGTGTGTVDITVTTPAGTSHLTTADHYTYTAPRPAVTGVTPDGGSTAGGTTVSITGTGLAGATGVRFGAAAAVITADSSTQVTVTSPPGTGTVTITVTTSAGTSKTTAGDYTYTTRPKPPQSISFTVPASGTAGGSATLSATGGGSGNPVVFSIDPASDPGVCTVSGTTVTYTAAGNCVIDANQAGTATYTAAPQVQRTITVNSGHKLSQSISFTAPATGTAGGSATLSATGGGSGNPVDFSAAPASGPGVCTVSGTTVTYTAAGNCVIDANQAGTGTYLAAPQVQRTITITSGHKLSQSISFTAPASGTAGRSATLSATGGGSGNPVVFSAAPTSGPGACTVSGTTVTYTAAGNCVIDANQAGTATYLAAPQVQQTITVTSAQKLPQSISFTPPASGAARGSATLSATGGGSGNPVVFSADPASGPGVCTVSGTTVTYTAAGNCVIDANQAGTGTYAAAPQVEQTITVNKPDSVG
jgi:hypothetical protein